MREIGLAKGKGVVLVDDEDFEYLSRFKWHLLTDPNTCYAKTTAFRGTSSGLMHRIILDAPDGMQVDHIDHNGLNNVRANLRLCTCAQNHANQQKRPGLLSQFKGVTFNKTANRWMARCKTNRRYTSLGYYDSEEDAARAYNDFAREHFGEFALLNEITDRSGLGV